MAKSNTPEQVPTDDSLALPAVVDMKFESALSELELLVRNMEEGHMPLEASIATYRRGSELLVHCQNLLKDAEQKIQILENGVLRDFDATRGDAR